MLKQLTSRKKSILSAIENFNDQNGYPPTIRELCKLVGLRAASTMHRHLEELKSSGYLSWEPACPRTLRIVRDEFNAGR